MPSLKDLQQIVDRLKSGFAPLVEVRALVHHQSPLVRANAIDALVGKAKRDGEALEEILRAALDPINNVPIMGTITVAHVAVASLLRARTPKADQIAKALLDTWPEPDRGDLIWYLESEGLQKP